MDVAERRVSLSSCEIVILLENAWVFTTLLSSHLIFVTPYYIAKSVLTLPLHRIVVISKHGYSLHSMFCNRCVCT